MWFSGGRGTENVFFDDESFDDFSEVGYHVKDVTSRHRSLGFFRYWG